MTLPSPFDLDLDVPDNAPPPAPPPPVPVVPDVPVQFPIRWILQHAPAPIQLRALAEVARFAPLPQKAPALAYGFLPGLLLAIRQAVDGTWNTRLLSVPDAGTKELSTVGTIPAMRRLLELGWERESPTLLSGRRILFRLLAEDDDRAFLFELAGEATTPDLVHRGRLVLREAAASVLAQAGYDNDPRLRGCAHRIIARVGDFLESPLAEKPWIRIGNKHVLSPDAQPPSIHLLHMLAFMPQFQLEQTEFMRRLFAYLSRPLPRQEVQQQVGSDVIAQPHLVMGDPLATRGVVDSDVPFALYWLELMARLGFLRQHEGWSRMFDRFLDECDRDRVWRPAKGETALATESPYVWGSYPLHAGATSDGVAADVTFRLGLIARLVGRPVELV